MITPRLSRRERLSLACTAVQGFAAGVARAVADWALSEFVG